ncbi:tRNA delta(2)-isopentenylpyrophosphate transferase [Magnetococcus marinus MC-1]|uniref:tRNA dimethylallyltransferase n=1 Tax=Magnetococcus marinus (strain ATCC BAA-1437 / JCM 17883 / MC-1) TaxID=156889 RepID=MIAA_MAGMM|nr:tRNA (adenosine(37)-N6)-dimethylallyltransferase MiaA [Magnetococcus marinus]A0L4B0.1 RecName: Full=tRNA dimethylallyltransferase; AltName: Full=Dimethylallyl diphosphate:tRNA dimethylallyltransferase; Short=DMAPP:tRNA dimethylallyltransferase; Short=DMATase; AltName: Full=Isopentenyl-diphosphate:tRNA isopentenyltransferase; Short=IPP transferase; Short=IPPT; Short=IPTase [Magnetococcus marinus MC-1]ABK42803.1 tRNA delta(2)-isopentenylpyrophosphate transferase [Magnetococcus marinus MC-1]
MGPTASGKTGLALHLAEHFPLEIVNADSVQVYRGMDIGSAKPTLQERQAIVHHLIDVTTPDDPFSAGRFRTAALEVIEDCHRRGVIPALVGGTGFYFRAVEQGIAEIPEVDAQIVAELNRRVCDEVGLACCYAQLQQVDPPWAARVEPGDRQRIVRGLSVYLASGQPLSYWQQLSCQQAPEGPALRICKLAIEWPREQLYARINQRFEQMLKEGFMEEVQGLLSRGYHGDLPAMRAVGYRALIGYLQGAYDLARAVELGQRDSRRYAKRQITWLKAEPGLQWLAPEGAKQAALDEVRAFLQFFKKK